MGWKIQKIIFAAILVKSLLLDVVSRLHFETKKLQVRRSSTLLKLNMRGDINTIFRFLLVPLLSSKS